MDVKNGRICCNITSGCLRDWELRVLMFLVIFIYEVKTQNGNIDRNRGILAKDGLFSVCPFFGSLIGPIWAISGSSYGEASCLRGLRKVAKVTDPMHIH